MNRLCAPGGALAFGQYGRLPQCGMQLNLWPESPRVFCCCCFGIHSTPSVIHKAGMRPGCSYDKLLN